MKGPVVGLTDENYSSLKKASTRRKVSMKSYLNDLLEQIGVADRQEKVILTIPDGLKKGNRDGMVQWLQTRMEAVIDIYYGKKK